MKRGLIYAFCAYFFWGVFPIYWKLLINVPSDQILAHRIVWSFAFFIILIIINRNNFNLIEKFKNSNNKLTLIAPALLIGSNWGVYIWAVNNGFVIETSLGYFISPLISVFLGVMFLKEKLGTMQWIGIGIASAGVLIMTFLCGNFPIIALYLAGSWGIYGLLRKKSPLDSIEGLTLETALLSIPAVIYMIFYTSSGKAPLFYDLRTNLLLLGSGIATGLPLLLFIKAARLVKLSLIGILQYSYPSIILLIGYFVYGEALSEAKLIGFIFIWVALAVYSLEGRVLLNKKAIAEME